VAASFFALGCAVIGGRAQAADPQQPLTKTVDTDFRRLRSDARYTALLHKMNLPAL
jgi:hypothetical protein